MVVVVVVVVVCVCVCVKEREYWKWLDEKVIIIVLMNEWVIRVIWRQYMTTPQRTASSRKLRPSGKRPEKMAAP